MSSGEKEQKRITRREFVKGAAVGAVGVAAAGVLASCAQEVTPCPPAPTAVPCPPCPVPGVPETWDEEADVVVCGYGAAGMPAAIDAADAGADVLIIEQLDWPGGNLRRCGGTMAGADTVVQKALGVEDSPDKMYEFMIACGEGFLDPALVRVYADNSGKNIDWIIEDLGAEIPYEKGPGFGMVPGLNIYWMESIFTPFEEFGMSEVWRSHTFSAAGEPWKGSVPYGTGLFKAFDDAINSREIRTMLETALIELVATPDREVLGVKALSQGKTLYIKARRGVFIGTGSWANNAKMLKDYLAEIKDVSPDPDLPANDGKGIIAGQAIGADLTNMGIGEDGGLRINPKAQVIDVFGEVIPRLYASGDVVGGILGKKNPGAGSNVAPSMCFGRIGGTNAAAEEPWG